LSCLSPGNCLGLKQIRIRNETTARASSPWISRRTASSSSATRPCRKSDCFHTAESSRGAVRFGFAPCHSRPASSSGINSCVQSPEFVPPGAGFPGTFRAPAECASCAPSSSESGLQSSPCAERSPRCCKCSGKSPTSTKSPVVVMHALEITLSSSRTFPGQGCRSNSVCARRVSPAIFFPYAAPRTVQIWRS